MGRSNLVGKIMVRSEYKYYMLGFGCLISRSRRGREGNRQAYLCRMFVAGEAPVARRTTGSATRPLVAAMKGRPRPRERTEKSWEGRGGRAAVGQGSVEGEGGARAEGRPRGERQAQGERREETGRGAEGAALLACCRVLVLPVKAEGTAAPADSIHA